MDIVAILVLILIFLVAALPLHFAVRLLGGRTTWLKSAGVNLLVGIITSLVHEFFPLLGFIIGFVLMLIIYRLLFRLRWWKTIVVWLLQAVFVALFVLLATLLGIGLFAAMIVA
jgi:hypothetical protein